MEKHKCLIHSLVLAYNAQRKGSEKRIRTGNHLVQAGEI